jgi:hypothetical protein
MPSHVFYRRVRSNGVWHILDRDAQTDFLEALCGESCEECSEGYMPANGRRREDPKGVCERCRLLADGARQPSLLEAT